MAISLDNHTDDVFSAGGASSLTFAATASAGANRLILGGTYVANNAGDHTEYITTVTYNAVGMTQLGKRENSGASGNTGWFYIYGLLAPSTGSNNLIISTTGGQGGRIHGVSSGFSGVRQTGLPEAIVTNHSASTTALTTSIATQSNNPGDFVYLFAGSTVSSAWVLGAGTTAIGTTSAGSDNQFQYSGNPVSPPGTVSMTVGPDVAAETSAIMIAIAAFGSSIASGGMFMVM